MLTKSIITLMFTAIPSLCLAVNSLNQFYCPQGHNTITIGMTADQVEALCGEAQIIHDDTQRVVQNVAATRLIYNRINTGSPYFWNLNKVYDQFSLPSGSHDSNMAFIIVDNKVSSINIQGNDIKNTTACSYAGSLEFPGGTNPTIQVSINVGDPVAKVYQNCGSPDYTDQTYLEQPVPLSEKPERWQYKLDQFQPTYQLIFIRGILTSIEQMNY